MKNNEILNLKKAKIEPVAPDEIFVQVKNTYNYWVSNYGRVVNNLKGNDKFYMYKTGNVHLTLTNYHYEGIRMPKETSNAELVAEHFLFNQKDKNRIRHIDGDKTNNYYKNLIFLDAKEAYNLQTGELSLNDLKERQEYIAYVYKGYEKAVEAYNLMYKRCHDEETKRYYPQYADSTMYKPWEKDPELFYDFYESEYYDCDGEQMVVDKDLLFKGNKDYAPGKVCLLPWTLNTMLSNSKKHYNAKYNRLKSELPYGVRYDESRDKYYAQILMDKALRDGEDKPLKLRYRDTPEEAFADYKRRKEAYIMLMADKYMKYLPVKIYDALLDYEVEPY